MRDPDLFRNLVITIKYGLSQGLARCHGMRRALTQDEQLDVSRTIAEQIERSNFTVERGEPLRAHSSPPTWFEED
jgi:hypothetical protein